MWHKWRPIFGWRTLCPIYFSDPLGLIVVMPRATQPVSQEDVDALPDYHPTITAELKADDYGLLLDNVLALDYGLPDKDMVQQRRDYYAGFLEKPAMELPK